SRTVRLWLAALHPIERRHCLGRLTARIRPSLSRVAAIGALLVLRRLRGMLIARFGGRSVVVSTDAGPLPGELRKEFIAGIVADDRSDLCPLGALECRHGDPLCY